MPNNLDVPPSMRQVRPFDHDRLTRRLFPFAMVLWLAAASLVIPPGPKSVQAALGAVALLLLVTAGNALPWSRLPAGAAVLMPLAVTGSVLLMVLSDSGVSSGMSVLVLAPLIWTGLYHQRWESAVVVTAVAAVELVTALVPVAEPPATAVRRVVFWVLLGGLLSIATHDLRDHVWHQSARREELMRQTTALAVAAEELTATTGPAGVVERAPRLAALLVAPSGNLDRWALYGRVHEDMVSVVAQYGATGLEVGQEFPVAELPPMARAVAARRAVFADLANEQLGPLLRDVSGRLGRAQAVCVPVIVSGELDGVLAAAWRGSDVPLELFEQCQALGHLVDLALANALMLQAAHEQAHTDVLTNLPNRRGFEAFMASRPGRRPYVIMVLDLDGLKSVNDSLGHRAGDEVLVRVADAVRYTMRRGDVLARIGGDEFAAYLFDADETDACRVAERMLEALVSPVETVSVSVSIGIGAG
ncbi:MAG TPA: GGDEF domain-containing protein, partial [Acidimicrobiales bacterium]|nr:GGDEF domain-containing protein [Acidimicrobiales bacterium]